MFNNGNNDDLLYPIFQMFGNIIYIALILFSIGSVYKKLCLTLKEVYLVPKKTFSRNFF